MGRLMDQDTKDYIDAQVKTESEKTTESEINKIFDRYGLKAEHMVFLKDLYERNAKIADMVRRTIIGAIILAMLGIGLTGFIANLAEKVGETAGS